MATKKYVRVLQSDESVARVSDTKAEWQDVEALIDGRIPEEAGLGNVVGPASASDGHLAVFDGPTGKLIKGGGAVSSVPVKASGAEADTGTNDTKFLTAKAVNDSHNVPSVAPGDDGNVLTSNGTDWVSEAPSGGGVTLETPTPVPDDVEDTFTGSAPPKMVFRNGVMELRLGTVVGNTFVFDVPPSTGDDIEFVV